MPGTQNSSSTLSFLDSLGNNDRGDKVKFNNVALALKEMAEHLVDTARANLENSGHTASGKTAASIHQSELMTNASRMQIDITLNKDYVFINDGVKGTEGGQGKYAFKNSHPNKKMALAIMKWIRVRRVATKYKALSKTEKKNQSIKKLSNKADSQKSLAYAIATNIKKKGIKPTKFFTKAVEATRKEQKKRFADALKLDIIETFS